MARVLLTMLLSFALHLQESHWTRTAVQERLHTWFGDAKHANPFARVLATARKPEPYNMPAKQTVAQVRSSYHSVCNLFPLQFAPSPVQQVSRRAGVVHV